MRGELRFILPPGYCCNEIGQIEMDPDERVSGVIRLLFDKFQELGSARQVLLWAQDQALQLPITRRNNSSVCKIEWRPAAYHTVLQILRHPVYACAYVFGRTTQRTCQRAPKFPQKWAVKIPSLGGRCFGSVISHRIDRRGPLMVADRVASAPAVDGEASSI